MKPNGTRQINAIASLLPRAHFRFTTLSGIVLFLFLAASVGAASGTLPASAQLDIALLAAAVAGVWIVLLLLPFWAVDFLGIAALWAVVLVYSRPGDLYALLVPLAIASVGLIIAPCFQVVSHWDRSVVLRLGKFNRIGGPGAYVIFPFIETIVELVDMRIRVTDFSAEQSITRDTVPVHVDALTFWMVWDAEKAILEVENYREAVALSAQTALRDSIGRNDLATLLSERERLGSEIQATLDAKTNPWGITILSIEFKEVLVPKELEDALSKQAQAERERQSRIILSSAELEIAHKFDEAAATYRENPTAFQLRAMNMVYDSIRTNKNMVLMPSSALDSMNLGTALAAAAFAKERGTSAGSTTEGQSSGSEKAETEK